MCGIIGCVGSSGEVTSLLLRGLRRLEYRGYDSSGIAAQNHGGVRIWKRSGKIRDLEAILPAEGIEARAALGHTRWATHGRPTDRNAHPHADCTGRVAVVHNGIIENHDELRAELVARGHTIRSETDTELLAHLIEEQSDAADLAEAVGRVLRLCRGAWGIAVLDASHPGELVGARLESPLVVGLGADRHYLASDLPTLLEFTRDVVFLENGEVVQLRGAAVEIRGPDGTPRERGSQHIEWSTEVADKAGYPHYMLKEIHEQPIVLARTIAHHAADLGTDAFLARLGLAPPRARSMRRMLVIACGTSYHAGLVGKQWIERNARIPVEVDYGSEFRYRDPILDAETLVLAISQSGETTDTLASFGHAAGQGCPRIAICNVEGSSLMREADATLLTRAGPEIGVASTKAFTTQLAVLYLLSLGLGRARGVLSDAEVEEALVKLKALGVQAETLLARREDSARLARDLEGVEDFLFLGRGLNYPVALEGALKLKEISYLHAEGYPAGEMKHGPIALVDPGLPAIFLATPGRVYEKVLSNVQEVRARKGRAILVVEDGDEKARAVAWRHLSIPVVDEDLAPILNVIPLQLLAYHVANNRGCDVDQPRNLAKSVTVE